MAPQTLTDRRAGGRGRYTVEVTPAQGNRWSGCLLRDADVPSSLTPFYGDTPREALEALVGRLSQAHGTADSKKQPRVERYRDGAWSGQSPARSTESPAGHVLRIRPRRDPDRVAEVADSLEFEHKYSFGVILMLGIDVAPLHTVLVKGSTKDT